MGIPMREELVLEGVFSEFISGKSLLEEIQFFFHEASILRNWEINYYRTVEKNVKEKLNNLKNRTQKVSLAKLIISQRRKLQSQLVALQLLAVIIKILGEL